MPTRLRPIVTALLLLLTAALSFDTVPVDWAMVARIREEGLQRSRVMDFESYMTDVLGARLTMSRDMQRGQTWLQAEMTRLGLVNVAAEPYLDYGVTWDNEYVSLHLLEPDYTPMVGYPIAYTPGTDGRKVAQAVVVDLQVRGDLDRLRGTLRGKAVLVTPAATPSAL
jgi:carboxypeptidase Q